MYNPSLVRQLCTDILSHEEPDKSKNSSPCCKP